MTPEIIQDIVSKLAPKGFDEPTKSEAAFPARQLPAEALVTRLAPSPTGFMHVGTVYAALVNERLARRSGGVYFVRIEDTDKKREVEGGVELIKKALEAFELLPDEGLDAGGAYGPYVQSQREQVYIGYAVELLKSGKAYPAFDSDDELTKAREAQTAEKVRPGYYGKYATWRTKTPDEVKAALAAGKPFVLRLKSTGDHSKRITVKDVLKGSLQLPENDLDIPLIKSDGLPTYHLAHVVDDHLMRTNIVVRGEEWLSSTPLHIELAMALQIMPFNYAHLAPISILDGGAKRKLSKRKDDVADIGNWLDQGYPPASIIEYLMRLANSNYEDWRKINPIASYRDFPFTLAKLAASRAPLVDMKKLRDVSRDAIAAMDQEQFTAQLMAWIKSHDAELAKLLEADVAYTTKILTLERSGANRRKDLASWSEARAMYGYFFDDIYKVGLEDTITRELGKIDFITQKQAIDTFLETYDETDDQPTWLTKMREAAKKSGFSSDNQSYKSHPEEFKGAFGDFAKILRVRMTGQPNTPDLYELMQIMGKDRVKARLSL